MHISARGTIWATLSLGLVIFISVPKSSLAESSSDSPYGSTSNGSSAAGAGKAFNPDISVNFLGLYRRDVHGSENRSDSHKNGLQFQEAETQFVSDVDPYFRANALFSLSPKEKDFTLDPEEVFLETIALPVVTIRAGKFKAAFGRHNQLHTHAYPFIEPPLINTDLLGDEGLNEMGVSASILLPTTWYGELTLQGLSNNNETLFNSPKSRDFAHLAYLKNLWDLTDDFTLELGLYGVDGPNQYKGNTQAYGSDFILKWRPSVGGKYQALIWQTEYLKGRREKNPAGERLGGVASWVQYQFAERWWAQARVEYEGLPHSDGLPVKRKQSALIGFFPSEFSGFRLQYDHLLADGSPHDHIVTLQYNISIGAHPAHAY